MADKLVCKKCGESLAATSKTMCERHLKMQRERSRRYYNKMKKDSEWVKKQNEKQQENFKRPEVKQRARDYKKRPEVKPKIKANQKRSYDKNKKVPEWRERKNSNARELYRKDRKRIRTMKNATASKLNNEAREQCFEHYSDGKPRCNCCDEDTELFLDMDHIEGVTERYPRNLRGKRLCRRIVIDGFPDEFQILCENCNYAKHILGKCPHKEKG